LPTESALTARGSVEIDMSSIYMLLKSVHLFTNYFVQVLTDNYFPN